MNTRRDFLRTVGLGVAVFALSGFATAQLNSTASGKRPNIVLIMADDMGFSDIGCYGSEIETPNLDKLAGNGLRYTQFYNGARCCPTRASLLTGLYAHQAGLGEMEPDRKHPGYRGVINHQCVTLAEALRFNGYETHMAGKWHLTNKKNAQKAEDLATWPRGRGFDHFYGIIGGASDYFTPEGLTRGVENIEQEAKDQDDYYFTDAVSDNSATFIREHSQKKPDTPFFSYVAYTAPHWKLQAKDVDIAKYEKRYVKGWDVLREERHKRMLKMGIVEKKWALSERDPLVPAWDEVEKAELPEKVTKALEKSGRGIKEEMARKMAVYAGMIDCMDQGIGRIVKALKETGQLDNTLILFLADNGGCNEWGTYGFGWNRQIDNGVLAGRKGSSISYGPCWANPSNTPFRRYKLDTHEGGISTPLIAHWPKGIKSQNEFRYQMSHIIDIMPTCIDVAGGRYPKEYAGNIIQPMEGMSLVPSFDANKPLEREYLCWEHIGGRAIRMGKWKLVAHRESSPWELYDIEADRTELHDLATKQPQRVAKLEKVWTEWATRCNVLPLNPRPNKK
jgi:arylsulfatase A-like enzyme